MKKPFIMIRLKEPDYLTAQARDRFISVMKKSGKAVDSVALIVGNFHNFLPLRELEPCLAAIEDAIRDIRAKLGTLTGINVLATIGHREEAQGCWELKNMPPMIDYDGKSCKYTPCPASDEFLNETGAKYGALAKLAPQFIWIDDDFRMHNHLPASIGCFCNRCLEGFAKFSGLSYSRKELVSRLIQDTAEAERFRAKFLAWCDRILFNIVRIIEREVHKENPHIILSIMICGGITYDYPSYLNTLRRHTGIAFVRPGGGFYTDAFPFRLIEKSVEYSRQIPLLGVMPKDVVLAEVEHFPYNAPLKSQRIYSTEITASIAAGCDGATINISSMIPDVFHECEPFLRESEKKELFWRALSDEVRGMPVAGAWLPKYSSHASLKGHLGVKLPEFPGSPVNFVAIGVPITGDRNAGEISLLTRTVIDGMSLKDLAEILSKPAILDATAVDYINKKGLSHLVGVDIEKEIRGHCVEEFIDFEENLKLAGKFRDSRPGFFGYRSAVFKFLSDEVKPLCALKTDYKDGRFIGFSAAIFKNPSGAKIVSFGYDPWNYIFSESKIHQLHALIRYITDDTFPLIVLSPARVCPFLRCESDGKLVVVLVNASFDETKEIKFYIPRIFRRIEVLNTKGVWEKCRYLKNKETNRINVKYKVGPWDALALRIV